MDLYLVIDLSVSVTQNSDCERCIKVQRAFRFAEVLIKEIDKNEVTIHLIYLIGSPTLAKSNITNPSEVRPLFKSLMDSKADQEFLGESDYRALKDLIYSHKTSHNYEVLLVTDLSEEIQFPDALKMACLLRFVLLTNFTEHLSERLVATLECVSLNCGLEAMFAPCITELNNKLHFPLMIGDYRDEMEMARAISQEERTVKDVTLTLNPSITLKATLSPGLPKRLVIMESEMLYRQVVSSQAPTFKFVGASLINSISKLHSTDLIFEVCPRNGESQQNTDAFRKLFDALVETKTVAILVHSSGEECYLRPLKVNGSEENCALIMQFYASQYVDWKGLQEQAAPIENPHYFSYKPIQMVWTDTTDMQTDVNKLCRRLKREVDFKPVYKEAHSMFVFAIASGFSEFAPDFANLLEKRAEVQQLTDCQPLTAMLQWLRSPNGFHVACGEIARLLL